jgi:hypothetical protein
MPFDDKFCNAGCYPGSLQKGRILHSLGRDRGPGTAVCLRKSTISRAWVRTFTALHSLELPTLLLYVVDNTEQQCLVLKFNVLFTT